MRDAELSAADWIHGHERKWQYENQRGKSSVYGAA